MRLYHCVRSLLPPFARCSPTQSPSALLQEEEEEGVKGPFLTTTRNQERERKKRGGELPSERGRRRSWEVGGGGDILYCILYTERMCFKPPGMEFTNILLNEKNILPQTRRETIRLILCINNIKLIYIFSIGEFYTKKVDLSVRCEKKAVPPLCVCTARRWQNTRKRDIWIWKEGRPSLRSSRNATHNIIIYCDALPDQ